MLYMVFLYGREPVLIQRILIGFEAILENVFQLFKMHILKDVNKEGN